MDADRTLYVGSSAGANKHAPLHTSTECAHLDGYDYREATERERERRRLCQRCVNDDRPSGERSLARRLERDVDAAEVAPTEHDRERGGA